MFRYNDNYLSNEWIFNEITEKYESYKNISRIVKEYENQFIPGTVLLSEKAGYKLRIEYPME